jgi:hypothetical protein
MVRGMTPDAEDPLDRLGRTPGDEARFVETLPALVSAALGEGGGAVAVRVDEDGAAWIVRGGVHVTRFDPGAMASLSPADAERAVTAFAELIRRYDRERALLDDLAAGAKVRVDYKNTGLRRVFRTTGTVRSVSAFRSGVGVRAGGWTVDLEVRPRFGKPAVQRIESESITEVTPL